MHMMYDSVQLYNNFVLCFVFFETLVIEKFSIAEVTFQMPFKIKSSFSVR